MAYIFAKAIGLFHRSRFAHVIDPDFTEMADALGASAMESSFVPGLGKASASSQPRT